MLEFSQQAMTRDVAGVDAPGRARPTDSSRIRFEVGGDEAGMLSKSQWASVTGHFKIAMTHGGALLIQ